MCFDSSDSDWTASIVEEHDKAAVTVTRCDECRKEIAIGDFIHTVRHQENECCSICDESGEQDDEYDPQEPSTCNHDYGNVFIYERCEACDKLLKAIEAVEIDEGCPPHARQPMYTELGQVLIDLKRYEVVAFRKYRKRALAMFPELASHPFLKQASQIPCGTR